MAESKEHFNQNKKFMKEKLGGCRDLADKIYKEKVIEDMCKFDIEHQYISEKVFESTKNYQFRIAPSLTKFPQYKKLKDELLHSGEICILTK